MFKWILNSSVLIIFQNHFGQQKLVLSWALIRCGALSNLDFSWSEKWEHKHEGLIATEWQSLAVDAQKQFKPQGTAVILHSSNVILLSLLSRQQWKFNEKMIVFPTDVTKLHLALKKKGSQSLWNNQRCSCGANIATHCTLEKVESTYGCVKNQFL